MIRGLLGISGLALALAAAACSTGSGHPPGPDAGTGGKSSGDSATGGSAGTDADNAPSACGVFTTGVASTYETATLRGQAWTDSNSESNARIYGAAEGSPICVQGTVLPTSNGDYGYAILALDVNTVLQTFTNADVDAGAGTAISAWNSLVPYSSGLIVNVNNKAQKNLRVCVQGSNYDYWCVQNWTNSELIAWTDFTEEKGQFASYAMQPLMSINFEVPDGTGSFDFCINSVVEAASWCACPGGNCACPAGTNACNGTCVPDTSVNPLNCGACGKVCQSTSACRDGECSDSLCGDLDTPNSISLDGGDLYFTEPGAGTVMKAALSGGTPETVASGQSTPTRIVATGGNVYWVNAGTQANNYSDGSIMSLVGGELTTIARSQNNVVSLAVDSKYAYWANAGTKSNQYADGSIMKADLASGTDPVPLAKGRVHPIAIALDASNIYWVEQGTSDWGSPVSDGNVMKLAFDADASAMQTLASSQPSPMAIAVDANNVYYATADTVFKISLPDGKSTQLATGQSQPFALVADATDVYWTNVFSGTLSSVPIAGGAKPVILARAQTYALGFALDNTDVYWVTQTDIGAGGILKTPK